MAEQASPPPPKRDLTTGEAKQKFDALGDTLDKVIALNRELGAEAVRRVGLEQLQDQPRVHPRHAGDRDRPRPVHRDVRRQGHQRPGRRHDRDLQAHVGRSPRQRRSTPPARTRSASCSANLSAHAGPAAQADRRELGAAQRPSTSRRPSSRSQLDGTILERQRELPARRRLLGGRAEGSRSQPAGRQHRAQLRRLPSPAGTSSAAAKPTRAATSASAKGNKAAVARRQLQPDRRRRRQAVQDRDVRHGRDRAGRPDPRDGTGRGPRRRTS